MSTIRKDLGQLLVRSRREAVAIESGALLPARRHRRTITVVTVNPPPDDKATRVRAPGPRPSATRETCRRLPAVRRTEIHFPFYLTRMIDWSSCHAVERDPERYSGAWLFRGSRVPIAALFENLEDDATAHEFVEWFPGVTGEQVRAVLEHAARSGLSAA